MSTYLIEDNNAIAHEEKSFGKIEELDQLDKPDIYNPDVMPQEIKDHQAAVEIDAEASSSNDEQSEDVTGEEEEEEEEEDEEEDNATNDEDGPTMDEETDDSEYSDDEQQHQSSIESEEELQEKKQKEPEIDVQAVAEKTEETAETILLETAQTETKAPNQSSNASQEEKTVTASVITKDAQSPVMMMPPSTVFTTELIGSSKGSAPVGSLTAMADSIYKKSPYSRTSFVKVTTQAPQVTSTYTKTALQGLPYKVLSSREITTSYKPKVITTYSQTSIDQASTTAQVDTDSSIFAEQKTTEQKIVLPAVSGVIPDPSIMMAPPAPVPVEFSEQPRRAGLTKAKRWGCGC